jgi:hypothetical protein
VAGAEGGSNRSKGDAPVTGRGFEPLRNVDWIARGKFGFEGALRFYKDQNPQIPFDSVELRAAFVDRYLAFDELQFNQATNAVDRITSGHRPWTQADFKLILGHSDTAKYGVKLTYQRGSLPAVFANVKVFQFGFLYETKDRTEK